MKEIKDLKAEVSGLKDSLKRTKNTITKSKKSKTIRQIQAIFNIN